MRNQSTTIIALTGLILCIFGMSVFGTFVYMVEKQKTAYELQTVEQAEQEAYIETLKTLMRTLTETENQRLSLFSRVLKQGDVVNFLALIELIGREQKVDLITDSLAVEPVDDVFESLVMQVRVSGSYDGLMRMLTILEHLPYKSSIHNVSFEKESQNLWNSSYSIRVLQFKNI